MSYYRLLRVDKARMAVDALRCALGTGIAGRLRGKVSIDSVKALGGSRRFAAGILGIAALFLVWELLAPFLFTWRIRKIRAFPAATLAELKTSEPGVIKSLEYYSDASGSREIFGRIAVNEPAHTSAGPAKEKAGERVAHLTLIGIVSGADSKAVIEDKQSQKTYYLSKGQTLGEVKLVDILEGKIIVSVDGERFELYM